MAVNLGSIFYRLGVNTTGLNKANKDVKTFETKSKKSFDSMTKSANTLSRAIKGVIMAETVRRILKTGDSFQMLKNRINSMIGDMEKSKIVFSELQKISELTGSSLQVTAGGFQKMLFAKDTVGATTGEMVKLTKALTQLGMISDSDIAQMNSAMLQFSQGLISGTFQAQEFQSVLEGIPAIAQYMADGMGITRAELIKLKKEGELTSKDVFKALINQTDEINKKAQSLPMNMERGFSRLTLGISQAIDDINTATGLTETLGGAMFDVGEHVSNANIYFDVLIEKLNSVRESAGFVTKTVDVLAKVGGFIVGDDEEDKNAKKQGFLAKVQEEITKKAIEEEKKRQADQQKIDDQDIESKQKKAYALIKIDEWYNKTKKSFQKKYINEKGEIDNEDLKKERENLREQLDLASQGSKDAFNISKAVGIAELAVKTPQAIGSAYAWGTATGGPALGVISGALAGAFMGTQIQMIANQSYNGPRAIGGGVYSGGTYLVGENGPEILHMGSDRGFISPNSDLNGLGSSKTGNVNVNVYNVEGQTATVEKTQDGNGNMDISVIIKQVENTIADGVQSGTGTLNKSLQSVYGLNRAYGGF